MTNSKVYLSYFSLNAFIKPAPAGKVRFFFSDLLEARRQSSMKNINLVVRQF